MSVYMQPDYYNLQITLILWFSICMEQGVVAESNRLMRVLGVGAFLGTSVLASCSTELPQPSPEATPLGSITVCYDDDPECTTPLAQIRSGNSTPVDTIPAVCTEGVMVKEELSSQVDPDLIWALFSTEDREYCEVNGPNVMGLLKAAVDTLRGNPRGGSGIREQLSRIYYIGDVPDNLISRKFWESFEIAPTLDDAFADTEIVKLYLNSMYWGNGSYGIYEASMMYFGKDPSQLEIDEASFLVGALQNPEKYAPKENANEDQIARDNGIIRRNEVLQNQVELGRLTQAQADEYKMRPLTRLPYSPQSRVGSNYAEADSINARAVVDEIIEQVIKASGMSYDELMASNVRIRSTILKKDQTALQNAIKSVPLPADGRQYGTMFIDDSGAVTGYIPGLYEKNGPNVNLLESPVIGGSLDKIHFVMELLERGYTSQSPMPDPDSVEWLNYDGNGRNYSVTETNHCPNRICTLEISLEKSVNGAFVGEVKRLEEAGDPILSTTLSRMETLDMEPGGLVGPAIILGGQEITPEERAMAVQKTVARQGQDSDMRFVNSFQLDNGQVSEYVAPVFEQIDPPELTVQLTAMMTGVIESGTAANAFAGIAGSTEIADKTGTAANNVSAANSAVFCDENGRNKTIFVIERQPGSLTSLGSESDGGNRPAKVTAAAIAPLIGSWCSIEQANQARLAQS